MNLRQIRKDPKAIERIREIDANKELSGEQRMAQIQKEFGSGDMRNTRRWLQKLGIRKVFNGSQESDHLKVARAKKHNKSKFYAVTWAQTSTPVHKQLLANILSYMEFLGGELLVIGGRYKNPNSLAASQRVQDNDVWDDSVLPYLTVNRHNIHKYVQVLADVKIQPTAQYPLTGLEGFSYLESSIIGSPKQHLKPMAVLEGYPHKVLASTGAVTISNYTDTKIGKHGEWNHIYGFVIVEIRDDEVFHIRNVSANDEGSFNDLYYNVDGGDVTQSDRLEAIVLGDLHSGSQDPVVLSNTLDFMAEMIPNKVVLHDVFDGHSISHHHDKQPFVQIEKNRAGKDDLKCEIDDMISLLKESFSGHDVYVTRSNHDYHLDRYLNEKDFKKDILNAPMYIELAQAIIDGRAEKGLVPYLIESKLDNITCLGINDSLIIKGVECGLHGDVMQNGARGSIIGFSKLNTKTIIAHSHSPAIINGCVCVGTSTYLRLLYNKGASSWMNGHAIIDSYGKRQLILFTQGNFTTMKIK